MLKFYILKNNYIMNFLLELSGIDGYAARKLNQCSDFGAWVISFDKSNFYHICKFRNIKHQLHGYI